ncbi:MAG: DUF3795 domain-containing protein [Candidatus Cloacimonetes bacterium]|nr:DUF3795 domain-containing protein [Candidatus Cloacimonadota bacterium]
MEKKISACGLICSSCETFQATMTDDDAAREDIAVKWSKMYATQLKKDDINCTGCMEEGASFGYCSMCEIRECVVSKGLQNCAYCDDYGCDKLTEFFGFVPEAKHNLDEVRATL